MDPLLALLESVHGGIKGRVLDQDGEVLSEAAIQVQCVQDLEVEVEVGDRIHKIESNVPQVSDELQVAGIEKDMITTERGEYWRLLMPGTYHIRSKKACVTLLNVFSSHIMHSLRCCRIGFAICQQNSDAT